MHDEDQCESYYHNLMIATARAYVVANAIEADGERRPQPFLDSLSFDEAHAYLEGDEDIDAVAIPPELYRWAESFVLARYAPGKKPSAGSITGNRRRPRLTRRRLRKPSTEPNRPGENFLTRFNRLKTEAHRQALIIPADPDSHPAFDADAADMPPLASLDFDSDFSGFLSLDVSDAVRQQALRKLFHSFGQAFMALERRYLGSRPNQRRLPAS